jgi:hypothetical protein
MVNIENITGNPITEHKVDILDRLNPNMVIGRGVGRQMMIKMLGIQYNNNGLLVMRGCLSRNEKRRKSKEENE